MNDIIPREIRRVVDALERAEPGSEEYGRLLSNLNDLTYIEAARACSAKRREETAESPTPKSDTPAHVKAAVEEALGLTTEEAPAAEPKPEPKPEPDTGHTYTKEEVRAALAKSRKSGVSVTALLESLGYDNFSAVPAGEYGAVMAKLKEMTN